MKIQTNKENKIIRSMTENQKISKLNNSSILSKYNILNVTIAHPRELTWGNSPS